MALDDSAGLLFRIKADGSNATSELSRVESALSKLGGVTAQGVQHGFHEASSELSNFVAILTGDRLTGATSQITSFSEAVGAIPGPVGIAVGVLAGLTAAAIGVGEVLFKTAESTAEYGNKIHEASVQTGLSAVTISALKYAAETSGVSFERITTSVSKFNVVLGQAETGNKKAEATLKTYGITAKDTDGALVQAITHIASMTSATAQAAASQALFRDRTGEIAKVIKSFDGDLPGLIDKLRSMGLIMSDEDAEAAHAFHVQMETLEKQLDAVARMLGTQVMPVFMEFFVSLSQWLTQNQITVKAWAITIADALKLVVFNIRAAWRDLQVLALIMSGHYIEASVLLGSPLSAAQGHQEASARAEAPFSPGGGGGGKGGGKGASADDGEADRKKAIQAEEKDNAQRLASYKAELAVEEESLKTSLDQRFITETEYIRDVGALHLKALLFDKQLNDDLLQDARLNDEERHAIEVKQSVLNSDIQKERIKIGNQVFEQIQKEVKAEEEKWDKERKHEKEVEDRRRKRQAEADERDREQKLQDLKDRTSSTTLGGGGFAGGILNSIKAMTDATLNARDKQALATNSIKASWQSMGQVVIGVTDGMVNALGQVIQQWVLTGETGPAIMRKILATALATIAQEAAVRAIFELAKGFAALFFNPAEAGAHFTAAALFGSIAVGAAVSGRLVAGDAFKQQSSAATGSNSTSASSQHTAGGGGVYSSQPDQTVDGSRNKPFGTLHITIGMEKDGIAKVIRHDMKTNGPISEMVTNIAAA